MNLINKDKDGNNKSVMVFRNDKENRTIYNIGLSRKVKSGDIEEWQNGYILAQFNKEVSIENKTKIILKNAILDFYLNKNNQTVPFIRVFDYEIASESKEENGQFIEIPDGDLPF